MEKWRVVRRVQEAVRYAQVVVGAVLPVVVVLAHQRVQVDVLGRVKAAQEAVREHAKMGAQEAVLQHAQRHVMETAVAVTDVAELVLVLAVDAVVALRHVAVVVVDVVVVAVAVVLVVVIVVVVVEPVAVVKLVQVVAVAVMDAEEAAIWCRGAFKNSCLGQCTTTCFKVEWTIYCGQLKYRR